MLASFTVIVLFEVIGDFVQTVTELPIPGPVIGMVLLLVSLILTGGRSAGLDKAATTLLSFLPMLFVPAGVGVMAHFDLVRAEWPTILIAIVVSSVVAVIVTAATARFVERLQQRLRITAVCEPATGHPGAS